MDKGNSGDILAEDIEPLFDNGVIDYAVDEGGNGDWDAAITEVAAVDAMQLSSTTCATVAVPPAITENTPRSANAFVATKESERRLPRDPWAFLSNSMFSKEGAVKALVYPVAMAMPGLLVASCDAAYRMATGQHVNFNAWPGGLALHAAAFAAPLYVAEAVIAIGTGINTLRRGRIQAPPLAHG